MGRSEGDGVCEGRHGLTKSVKYADVNRQHARETETHAQHSPQDHKTTHPFDNNPQCTTHTDGYHHTPHSISQAFDDSLSIYTSTHCTSLHEQQPPPFGIPSLSESSSPYSCSPASSSVTSSAWWSPQSPAACPTRRRSARASLRCSQLTSGSTTPASHKST